MCRACNEGGRRCRDHRRLRTITLEQLRPPPAEGLPEINWNDDEGNPSPGPAELYERYDDQIAGATVAALQYLAAAEPEVTGDMVSAVPEGGRLHGLEFRMKSPGSLVGKIARKAEADPDASPYDVSEKVTDLLRYTAVAPKPEGLVTMARETVRRLKRRGWDMLEAEHSYVPGNPYKGLHTVLRHPQTGQEVELQFHTEDSMRTKEAWHGKYAIMRDGDRPRAERSEAYKAMAAAWQDIPTPAGLDRMHVLGGVSVKTRAYPNNYDTEQKGRRP